jgi:hypothetical protein
MLTLLSVLTINVAETSLLVCQDSAAHTALPLCVRESNFSHGRFCVEYDDEAATLSRYRWEPYACRLRRLTHWQAVKCFDDKLLFMQGDSRMRYQYTSLAYFLARGKWDRLGAGKCPDAQHCDGSVVAEKEFPNWPTFFRHSTFEGSEICDCSRNTKNMRESGENRFLFLGEPKKLAITYFMNYEHTFSGHSGFPPDNITQTCSPFCDRPFNWRTEFAKFYETTLRRLNPTHMLVASGWKSFIEPERKLVAAEFQRRKQNGQRSILRTRLKEAANTQQSDTSEIANWTDIFDAHVITSEAFKLTSVKPMWDGLHYYGWVNEEMNHVFLNLIC